MRVDQKLELLRAIKSVDILGKRYSVREEPLLADLAGAHVKYRCTIQWNPEQDIQQIQDTILHEVMHGVCAEMGLTTDWKEDTEPTEETVVTRMSTGMLYVLRKNPKLVKFLVS